MDIIIANMVNMPQLPRAAAFCMEAMLPTAYIMNDYCHDNECSVMEVHVSNLNFTTTIYASFMLQMG